MASVQGKLLNLEAACIFLLPEHFMGFWNQCIETVSLKLKFEMLNIFKTTFTASFRIPCKFILNINFSLIDGEGIVHISF